MPYKSKQKQREFQKEWMRRRRLSWIISMGSCRFCGSKENLEIDHIDPRKKISHRIFSFKRDRLIQELSKCQILCSSCHKKKSNHERHLYNYKLNPDNILAIRVMRKNGWPVKFIARHFKVSPRTIYDVLLGKSWAKY